LNKYNYIPSRNESGDAKIQVFSTRRLKKPSPGGKFELVLIKNDEEELSMK